jgi:AraC-like DNA-binding protein
MVILSCVKSGKLSFYEHHEEKIYHAKESEIYLSSRQDIDIEADGDIFILFIADFFLKRYLSADSNDPIDYLYHALQQTHLLTRVDAVSIDALSLYLIDKITRPNTSSMRCEHDVIALLMHRFSLFDIIDPKIDAEELQIAKRAKNHLLQTFSDPPTIQELAHICATNESKLKKSFKKVYKTTLYRYIQRLRLEEANLLLKEQHLSIGEVARRVGYRHQGHFSKLFYESFGVYPKDLVRK